MFLLRHLGISVLFLVLLGGCGPDASKAELVPVREPLPAIFGPLSWTVTLDRLKALFPGKELRDEIPGWDGSEKLTVTMVWGLEWHPFGDSYISIARDGGGRIRWISIETSESREGCQIEPRTKTLGPCRSDYGPALLKVLGQLRRGLTTAYGPPEARKGLAGDYPGDPRERSYKWTRKGFDIVLGMDMGEDGAWAVNLFALRRVRRAKVSR